MTLTVELATRFFFTLVEYHHVMMITCAKLFISPIMHDKVMGQTLTSFTEAYAHSSSENVT